MNPLDNLELQAFARKLNEEMPIHTETTAKIKRSFSQGMPKNLMEYSAHVDNKFLNDNLAIVEEIAHRDQKHPIPKWFRDYQIKHFAKYGILKADGFFVRDRFFGRMFPREIYHHASMNFHNPGFTSVIGNTKVLGVELQAYTGTETDDNATSTQLLCFKPSAAATIGHWYSQIAIKRGTAGTGGNYRMGIYNNTGSETPNNLKGETANNAIPGTGTYTYQDLTNGGFEADTAILWMAFMQDNTTPKFVRIFSATGARLKGNLSATYGPLENPYAGVYSENDNNFLLKIRGN